MSHYTSATPRHAYNPSRVRQRLPTVTTWIFGLLFVGIAAQEHFARGGPRLARTIASGSSTSPRSAEDTLLLYEHASAAIPRGATVTAFKPQNRADDKQVLRVSHGQLPYHRVIPQAEPADFIITLGAPLGDPRYELLHANAAGAIWKRTQW